MYVGVRELSEINKKSVLKWCCVLNFGNNYCFSIAMLSVQKGGVKHSIYRIKHIQHLPFKFYMSV